MPTCAKCTASVPLDAKYCPECGARLPRGSKADARISESEDEEVHALLASANLLKLRGEWEAAIEKCMQALAIDSDSAAAHSLLGDIYRDQGKVGEAMHWYRLALDLRPDSTADRMKLDQLAPHGLPSLPTGESRMPGKTSRTTTRVIVEIIVVLVLGVLIGVVWPMIFKPPGAERAPRTESETTAGEPQRVRVAIPEAPPEPAEGPVQIAMSQRESALARAVNASPSLSRRGLQVVGFSLDPRTQMAIITFVGPAPRGEAAPQALVRNSLFVLHEVCLKNSRAEYFTVRALYRVSSAGVASSEIAFIAEAQRQSVLQVSPDTAAYEELLPAVENPWWHPGLR